MKEIHDILIIMAAFHVIDFNSYASSLKARKDLLIHAVGFETPLVLVFLPRLLFSERPRLMRLLLSQSQSTTL